MKFLLYMLYLISLKETVKYEYIHNLKFNNNLYKVMLTII